jgi:anti-sigma B factor antagonist
MTSKLTMTLHSTENGTANVSIGGEMNHVANVHDIIVRLLETKANNVNIDCSELEYINSTGLNALVKLHSLGINVRLMNIQPHVEDILIITKLDSFIKKPGEP